MTTATNRRVAAIALTGAALAAAVTGCGGAGAHSGGRASTAAKMLPAKIISAPRDLRAVTREGPGGTLWALGGGRSAGLYLLDVRADRVRDSFSVNGAAQSVAESARGVLGLALGARRSGALQLIASGHAKPFKTVPLPAPARSVVTDRAAATFYVLSGSATSASVTLVSAATGKVAGAIPAPRDTVSVMPDASQHLLYVLERDGVVDEISLTTKRVTSRFSIGHGPAASLALSSDGGTLYVLKRAGHTDNIAVVNLATQSVRDVLPAPAHCVQVLASPSGTTLLEVASTRGFSNIQVFAVSAADAARR